MRHDNFNFNFLDLAVTSVMQVTDPLLAGVEMRQTGRCSSGLLSKSLLDFFPFLTDKNLPQMASSEQACSEDID